MCGIVGGWFPDASSRIDNRINAALAAMRLRGPDDQGYVKTDVAAGVLALGHTRLSIIDLTPGGHQPMQSVDGRFSIVFNGEIYNYRELRRMLIVAGYTFQSDSDTEVLLAAWSHWGPSCLNRLVGMFAFTVFDRAAATLFCVRDAYGIKPFYYAVENGEFLFASEIGAIKKLKQQKVQLDWQQAYDYLVHADYDSGERSFLRDVCHLMPGHILTINLTNGTRTLDTWWQPNITRTSNISFGEAAEFVREMFLDSIRMHLRSDVPLGAALSGGVDSSAVVCAMRHLEPLAAINTFSYIAQGTSLSEEVWIDCVNARVGAIPHKVSVSAAELVADLDDMIVAQGEPFGSTSIYAQYRVFKLAKDNGITVTLDGQGADELLAGYIGYPGSRLRSLVDDRRYGDAWRFLDEWARWPGRSWMGGAQRLIGELTSGALNKALRGLSGRSDTPRWINAEVLREAGVALAFPHIASPSNANGRRVMAALALALTRRGLPALLRHGDRNSMRFSVESRVPFLTTKMADFLLSLPEEYLISQTGETKSVFRAAMRGIVPDEILDRKDKIGFATPEQEWLLAMSGTFRKWLSVDLQLPFFNQCEVLREFDLIVAGRKPFNWQVWRWINFARWYTQFVF